jgi:hypothetical protein
LFIQDLVFKSKLDGALKTALKCSQTVVDTLDNELIRALWEVIETKSAGMAALSSPVDALPAPELEVGDHDLVVMSAIFGTDQLEAMSATS